MLIRNNKRDNMGFVYLAEQTNSGVKDVKNIVTKKIEDILIVEFDTNLHSFDVLNRNKRIYTGDNVYNAIMNDERLISLMHDNSWFGEMDHPMQKYKDVPLAPERIQSIDMDRRSHKIMNPKINGNLLTAHIQTAADGKGPGFAKEIIAGLKPNFSCRSIASLDNVGGKPIVTIKKLITYDWVLFPSHKEAHITSNPTVKELSSPTMESVDSVGSSDVIMPLYEILESIKESDRNINIIMESFGLTKEDFLGFKNTRNRKHGLAMFREGANRLCVSMDEDTKNQVDDFFSSF